MLTGVVVVIFSALLWVLSEGVIAWVAGASFLFFGVVVVYGFFSQGGGGEGGETVSLQGDGSYSCDIVGESHYQRALARIAGPKEAASKAFECEALIVHEPDNPHDKNACVVIINGQTVGHLSRADARKQVRFRNSPGFVLKARAMIVGGWKKGRDEGSYGVKLDYVPLDLRCGPLGGKR